jgi:hypothetical protein
MHFWLAAERQIAWSAGELEHPPAGIREMPPTKALFENIWEHAAAATARQASHYD